MPIRDIQTRGPSLSRIGIIRLGTKHPQKNYPMDADHFVLTDAPDIAAVYGEEPRELFIYLPFDDVDRNFPAHHELWSATGCLCRGDGERIVDRLEGATRVIRSGQVISGYVEQDGSPQGPGAVVACPGLNRTEDFYPRCKDCRPRGMLIVMVRDPMRPTQLVNDRLGYYQVSTHSFYNIQNVSSQLAYAAQLASNMGRGLRGIPMILRRREQEITYTDSKSNQRKTVKKWLLDLEFDYQWVQVANATMHQLAVSSPTEIHALPSGMVVTEDGEIVDEDDGGYSPPSVVVVSSPQQAANSNGNGHSGPKRPYDPETFKQRWQEVLPVFERNSPGPIEAGVRGLVVSKIEDCFHEDVPEVRTRKRHVFIQFVVGKISTNHFTQAEGKLMLKLLDDGNALSEVRAIVRHAERLSSADQSQEELPLGEGSDEESIPF
jgi:hypothetical protein